MDSLPWNKPGRFWRGNLHAHSTISWGKVSLDEAVGRYRKQGYDFLAVTEPLNDAEYRTVADTRRYRDQHFTTLIGAEPYLPGSAIGGNLFLNILGIPVDFELPTDSGTIPEVARRARDCGAFVAVACPYWCVTTLQDVLDIDAAHAIETWNETAHGHNDRGDSWHLVDGAAGLGRRLNGLAVDDTHFNEGWPDQFGAWTLVRSERLDPDSLLDALKASHYYSTRGPTIHDVCIESDTIHVACSPARAIFVTGIGPRADRRHGPSLTEAQFPAHVFRGGYCRITVVGVDSRRAWSNPIWLD